MKKLTIQPLGESALVTTGAPLLSALLAKDLKILMSCGGKGICSTCHVRIRCGMDQLSPISPKERRTLALVADSSPDSRLACQTAVYGDGVEVVVPEGMYIEKADDLLSLLGTRAPENILHPITGVILIPKGKIITRTMLEQSRSLEQEVKRLRVSNSDSTHSHISQRPHFTASGVSIRPNLSGTTQFIHRTTLDSRLLGTATPPPQQPQSSPAPGPPQGMPSNTGSVSPSPPTQNLFGATVVPTTGSEIRTSAPPIPASRTESLATSTPPTPFQPGSQIDKYLLLEMVGKGGAGVVYRALHTKLKTLVAVKFLRTDVGEASPSSLERLAQEAQLLAQLSHPNIVRVLDFEDHPIRPYVVMEFVDGLTAADLIKQSGRVASPRAVQIVLDVIAGLEAAYMMGIIHRDVKPGNILVSRDGTCKLVDLGLATLHQPALSVNASDRTSGPIAGTVGYIAPEVLNGGIGDHRADIYSLGATMFHLIAGRLPFLGRSTAEVVFKHLQQPPPILHELVPDAPHELSTMIQTMMAKSPADRYQDYADLRKELKSLQHALPCA